jgi:tetratricopeptide (TPR) repeat protein
MDEIVAKTSQQAFKEYRKKNFLAARDGFQQCVDLLVKDGDEKDLAEMRNNLSVTLTDLQEWQQAYDTVAGTEAVFEKLGDYKSQAMALANLGTALQGLGRKEEALAAFEKSSDLFKTTGEKLMRATVLKKISDLQLTSGKPLQALASMQASYDQKEKKSCKDKVLNTALGQYLQRLIR